MLAIAFFMGFPSERTCARPNRSSVSERRWGPDAKQVSEPAWGSLRLSAPARSDYCRITGRPPGSKRGGVGTTGCVSCHRIRAGPVCRDSAPGVPGFAGDRPARRSRPVARDSSHCGPGRPGRQSRSRETLQWQPARRAAVGHRGRGPTIDVHLPVHRFERRKIVAPSLNYCVGGELCVGRPTRRTRSSKRGSERSDSNVGSTLSQTIRPARSW